MKWLYILFTLVMDVPNVPNVPNPNPNPNVPNPNKIDIKIPLSRPASSGIDERFPFVSNEEEVERIRLHLYYLEQIQELESNTHIRTLELAIPIVEEVLPIDKILPCKMKAGGLMDDWERNI